MRDVYLWTGVLLGSFLLVALVVIACVTWWLDWQSRRVRPSVRFVGPAIELPPARALNEPTQVLRFVGRATVVDGWAALAEFARPEPTAAALIGSDVEALFTLRRLAVAA